MMQNNSMKKSLWVRALLILAIMAAWSWTLFPLKDTGVMEAFDRLAKVDTYAAEIAKAGPNAEAVKAAEAALASEKAGCKFDDKAAALKKAEEALASAAADKKAEQEKAVAAAKAEFDAAKDRIAPLEKKLTAALAPLDPPRYNTYTALQKNYAALKERMERINGEYKKKHDNNDMSPQTLLVQAARGTSMTDYINLRDFFPRYAGKEHISNKQVVRYVRQESRGRLRKGMDLAGGVEFIVNFTKDKDSQESDDRIAEQVRKILDQRINGQGVVDANVQIVKGMNKISVNLPAMNEADKADIETQIMMPAKLQFYEVHPENEMEIARYHQDPQGYRVPPGYRLDVIESERQGKFDREFLLLKEHVPGDLAGQLSGKGIAVAGESAAMVKTAYATHDPLEGFCVHINFTPKGGTLFGQLTKKLQPVGNKRFRLAIALDDKVYSAPSINEPILGGNCQISGNFTQEEARILADAIASGNLPAKLKIDSVFSTSPQLGEETVRQGWTASVIGVCAVFGFILFYYRISGLIACTALAFNVILTLGTMALLGAQITMPGVAGLVLGLGMSVDANVLVNERMRDELAKGKTLSYAIKAAYDRAFWPIFDSNVTAIITSLVLYKYGTGPVRGFAITLAFGIAASMFTALTVTRFLFDLLLHNDWLKSVSMAGWFNRRWNLHVLRFSKHALILSWLLIAVTFGVALAKGKGIFSIDFMGGVKLSYSANNQLFTKEGKVALPSADEIEAYLKSDANKAAFGSYELKNPRVGYKSGDLGRSMLDITLPTFDSVAIKAAGKDNKTPTEVISGLLKEKYGDGAFTLAAENTVGNLVGQDFKTKAVLSLLLASLATIVYMAFRFELAYGVAAVIACIHDMVIAAGIYLATGEQLSLTVLAALLTILGFSLNDTIVIFDRVREELQLYPTKDYSLIIEDSVNDMFARTILTCFSTILGVIVLVIFGGSSLWEFSIVMLYGVIIGSYSTIYIACYIVLRWHKPVRGHKDSHGVLPPKPEAAPAK